MFLWSLLTTWKFSRFLQEIRQKSHVTCDKVRQLRAGRPRSQRLRCVWRRRGNPLLLLRERRRNIFYRLPSDVCDGFGRAFKGAMAVRSKGVWTYGHRCYGRTCRERLVVRPRELWTTVNEKWNGMNEIWGKWTVDEREWMAWLAIGYVYTWTDYFIQRAVKWNVVENTLPCASAAVFYQSALKYII